VARAGRRSARLHTRRRGNELDLLLDLGLPGIVFVALAVWLIRKAVKAARTEDDLEHQRFQGNLADELARGRAVAAGQAPADPVAANPRHEPRTVLWRHSTATHTIWCERDAGGHEVVRVARLATGEVIAEFS
jgi:hypothetical protein